MAENDYIKNNETFLRLLNKEEAVSAFTLQQPEKQKIDILKQEIEQLQPTLKSNDEQKNRLQRSINFLSDECKKVEDKQKQELQQARQFCEKRDKMLASLPPSIRDKAAKQFQKLSQAQDEFYLRDAKPEKIFPSVGFMSKLIHGKKLKEFDAQFADIERKMENGDISANFDMSALFEEIAKGINQKYDKQKEDLQTKANDKKKELNTVESCLDSDHKALHIKENELAQNENSLNDKVNKFSAVYDTHPFIDNSYIDPVVKKALDNGQIHGEDREKKVLASLLTKACQNSDVAKDVLYEALNKGTKYFISEPFTFDRAAGQYGEGVISVNSGTLNSMGSANKEVEVMSTLVHESRHACQDTGDNVKNNNWANTFIQQSMQEVDAYSIQAAAVYQLNHQLGTSAYQNTIDGHTHILKAFSQEYERTKDIRKSLNAAALKWNDEYGFRYKTDYINQNWCFLQENAETIHPEEIAKRNNIMYQGKSYMDIEKITEQILTVHIDDYNEIKQKVELSGKKDDSLQYFYIETPEHKKDENGQRMKDEFGFDAIEYKITPPMKKFTYSQKETQPEANNRIPFKAMSLQEQAKFIKEGLRQGKNPYSNSETNTTVPTRGQAVEKGKISSPLKFNKGKGMEI